MIEKTVTWWIAKNWGWYTIEYNHPEKLGLVSKTIKHRGFIFIVTEEKEVSG